MKCILLFFDDIELHWLQIIKNSKNVSFSNLQIVVSSASQHPRGTSPASTILIIESPLRLHREVPFCHLGFQLDLLAQAAPKGHKGVG